MELNTARFKLADKFPDLAKTMAQRLHRKAAEIEYVEKGIPIDPATISIEEGERAAIRLITTPHLDRDQEIIMPDGMDLADFRKAPVVLYAHNYGGLPIGRDLWIKPTEKGILAKTVYAEHALAEDVFQCVRGKFLNTSSVGFIPVEAVDGSDKEAFEKVCDRLDKEFGIPRTMSGKARRIYTKTILLEHSDVPVPSNPHALNVAVAKGLIALESDQFRKDIDLKDEKEAEPLVDPKPSAPGSEVVGDGEPFPAEKPYPNEHACRLREPGAFEEGSFRRVSRDHEGKKYSVIMGRLKGDSAMTEQAYRYAKDTWAADEARAHCKAHDGKFEAATSERCADCALTDEELSFVNDNLEAEIAKRVDEVLKEGRVLSGKNRRLIEDCAMKMHEACDALDSLLAATATDDGEGDDGKAAPKNPPLDSAPVERDIEIEMDAEPEDKELDIEIVPDDVVHDHEVDIEKVIEREVSRRLNAADLVAVVTNAVRNELDRLRGKVR